MAFAQVWGRRPFFGHVGTARSQRAARLQRGAGRKPVGRAASLVRQSRDGNTIGCSMPRRAVVSMKASEADNSGSPPSRQHTAAHPWACPTSVDLPFCACSLTAPRLSGHALFFLVNVSFQRVLFLSRYNESIRKCPTISRLCTVIVETLYRFLYRCSVDLDPHEDLGPSWHPNRKRRAGVAGSCC